MRISDCVAVVTGANRGVGRALVEALLNRGAARVYATARDPGRMEPILGLDPTRVVAVQLDLTRQDQISAAAELAGDVTLLINNAAAADFTPGLEAPRSSIVEQMLTNFLGTFDMVRAFVAALERNGGAIVNVMSLQSFSGTPGMDGYSASKAAMHSLTQSLRPALAARGVAISGVYPGGIDTDMLAGIDAPKSSPAVVAAGVLDGVEAGEEDIFPDPVSRYLASIWWSEPKRFERLFADQSVLIATLEKARREGVLSMGS